MGFKAPALAHLAQKQNTKEISEWERERERVRVRERERKEQ